MDFFKEDKAIFRRGGLKSAFKWSLITFPIIFILNFLALIIFFGKPLLGLLFLSVFPNILLILIYYFSLKRRISKFGLTTFSLRVEYVTIITILVIIYGVLSNLVITGKLDFPNFGIFSLVVMFLVSYFVKE